MNLVFVTFDVTDGGCLLLQGSRDNMSVVIVAFAGAPKITDDAKVKETELDARLETKVKGTLYQHCVIQ